MQVVWQYHVEEPVSAAGILPDHGAVRGSRPLYLVQRDAQPRRNSRNQETDPPLKIWDILNKQRRRVVDYEVGAIVQNRTMLIPPSAPLFIVYIETGIGPPLRITLVGPRKSARSFAGRADKRPGNVRLPMGQDTLLWCRVLRMPSINQKHHVVKYEPVIQPGSHEYLHHMTLYECRGDQAELETAAETTGSVCYVPDKPTFQCNTIAATWSLGSEVSEYIKFIVSYLFLYNFDHRKYPLTLHYVNLTFREVLHVIVQSTSGVSRLLYTDRLRGHDAGILSVGIDPNWRHIIPPGQPEVVSEGHCIADCTGQTIPNSGINMFAVIMHTHQLGRKVRLRQIRASEELPPIAADTNYDPNYQEYRRLQRPVKVYPGDHLVTECTYSSESRTAITLGGLGTREETCLVSVLYYPRIELSLCYSLPSLPTVLHSLGIQKLIQASSPVMIQEPPNLKGMTLEERLVSYDWESNFQSFQEATRSGTFKPLCGSSKGALPGTENLEVHYPRILRPYEEASVPCAKKPLRNKLSMLLSEDGDIGAPVDPDSDESNAVERGQLVRSKVSRSSDAGPTAGSSCGRTVSAAVILAAVTVVAGAAFR
ncbi:MOXD1 like protein 2 [Trachymyrmex cornetzi]|uniref:MOXD1 like protein 2 n=1 Tax=Trachymyrmex cornetzi TaxID=471704 RepID=A0A195E2N9_9HYME|nr:MOXD1 like protein 2 [Trachymyrmex cornetzi]